MTAPDVLGWSAARQGEKRRTYLWLGTITTAAVLLAGVGFVGGDAGMAIFAGAVALVGAFNLMTLSKHGVWGRAATARRYRVATIAAATIGLVLLGIALLFGLDGQVVPALGYG